MIHVCDWQVVQLPTDVCRVWRRARTQQIKKKDRWKHKAVLSHLVLWFKRSAVSSSESVPIVNSLFNVEISAANILFRLPGTTAASETELETATKYNTVLKALKIDRVVSIFLPQALFREVVLNNCIAISAERVLAWIRLALPCLMPWGYCQDSDECINTGKCLVNANWSSHPDETKPLAGLCWQVCGPGGSVSQAPADLQEGAESQTSYRALP